MKILLNTRLLNVLYFVMFAALWSACKDDDAAGTPVASSSEVKLLSFGPSGVKPGEKISLIGNNLDKVTSVELANASVPGSAFVTHTSELIVLTVPKEAGEGKVTLKTAAGDVVSKTILSFEVAVKIESVTAEAKPGDNITITGDYLNWIKEVRFARDTAITAFVSQTLTKLVVTVPLGAQTGPLIFSAGGTEPLTIETEKDLVIPVPKISAISPNPAEREKNLTIKGTDFDLARSILFSGVTAPITQFVSKTPTEIVVVIPKAATKGLVTVVAYSGVNVTSSDTLKFVSDSVKTK